jgi:hypothetical protein
MIMLLLLLMMIMKKKKKKMKMKMKSSIDNLVIDTISAHPSPAIGSALS